MITTLCMVGETVCCFVYTACILLCRRLAGHCKAGGGEGAIQGTHPHPHGPATKLGGKHWQQQKGMVVSGSSSWQWWQQQDCPLSTCALLTNPNPTCSNERCLNFSSCGSVPWLAVVVTNLIKAQMTHPVNRFSIELMTQCMLVWPAAVQVYFTVYGRLKTTLTSRPNGEHTAVSVASRQYRQRCAAGICQLQLPYQLLHQRRQWVSEQMHSTQRHTVQE